MTNNVYQLAAKVTTDPDKRSSTGNLVYFTDQFDNHPWENPELNHTLRTPVRGGGRGGGERRREEKVRGGGVKVFVFRGGEGRCLVQRKRRRRRRGTPLLHYRPWLVRMV